MYYVIAIKGGRKMKKKLIALVIVALLIGLVGGYGLGYTIYQPQDQSLQEALDALNDKVETINSTLTNTRSSVTSLQNELTTLSSEVANLNSTVEMMEKRTWYEVYSIEASSDTTSGTFQLKGSKVRVMCFAHSPNTDAWVEIILLFSNGTGYAVWGYSGVFTSDNAELEVPQAGDYYLAIHTFQTFYTVSVWDYY